MNLTKKPSSIIGIDRYTFFKILTDDSTGITYDEAVDYPGTVQINPTDSGGSDTFDADNGAYEVLSYIEKVGHDIENADIPPEVDSMWRGLEIKNGIVEVGGQTVAPYFGAAWRVMKTDGSYRYFRTYKGKYSFASNVGGKTKPSSGAPDRQTAKATYTAIQRDSDGAIYAYIDDDKLPEGVTKETLISKWFTDMDWVPTVTQ